MGETLIRCRRRGRRRRPSISARLLFSVSHRRAAIFLLGLLLILLPAGFARPPRAMSDGCLRRLHAIKSRCLACIDIWGSSLKRHARINALMQLQSPVVTPRNLLLLANVVVFIALVYLHLRSPAAARALKRGAKKKGLEIEGLAELVDLSAMEESEQQPMKWMPALVFDSSDIYEGEADECWPGGAAEARGSFNAAASSSAGATDSIDDIHDLNLMTRTRSSDLVGEAAAAAAAQRQSEAEDVNQRAFSTGSDGDVGKPAQKLLLQDGLIQGELQIYAPVSETSPSACQSEDQASHPHSATVSKSARLEYSNRLTDPESADPSLAFNPRVKSMDSTDKPSNVDGGQAASCRRKKKHSRDSAANAVNSRPLSLRREPSMTIQEELNARVETFISKFNQKIKIQRQQSLLSFLQMVNRGT